MQKCEEFQKFYSVMTQAPSGVPVVFGHKQIQTSDIRQERGTEWVKGAARGTHRVRRRTISNPRR
ncbi:hypothetical protein DAH20_26125 [Escherichia coli]|nr:hypothetical protein DAH20_26125 [Escherichia coli]